MSTAAAPYTLERTDLRTILTGGITLGAIAVLGVVVFALLSRGIGGRAGVILESVVVLAGGALATLLPAGVIRPRSIDAIGWTALTGFLGAVVFTFADLVALRPLSIYSWKWDAIGGGSGWWYIPIWWMGSTFLAWMGGWAYSVRARNREQVATLQLALQTTGLAVIIFAGLVITRLAPFHSAVAGLGSALSAVIMVPVTALLNRR